MIDDPCDGKVGAHHSKQCRGECSHYSRAVDSGDHFMTLATTAHSRGSRVATCGVPDWGGDITRYGTWNM